MERLERERLEQEALEAEIRAKEKAAQDELDRIRQEQERQENERLERERAERERIRKEQEAILRREQEAADAAKKKAELLERLLQVPMSEPPAPMRAFEPVVAKTVRAAVPALSLQVLDSDGPVRPAAYQPRRRSIDSTGSGLTGTPTSRPKSSRASRPVRAMSLEQLTPDPAENDPTPSRPVSRSGMSDDGMLSARLTVARPGSSRGRPLPASSAGLTMLDGGGSVPLARPPSSSGRGRLRTPRLERTNSMEVLRW
mmetsp:Transcript_9801/g.22498  ORF Transcript_9801/g.22498 Transcript_9801/m.22498 type:complete len:257 (+) Transcript_9801:807-1577(+)